MIRQLPRVLLTRIDDHCVKRPRSTGGRSGQAMVESVMVITLACLCFFAVFQFAHLFTAKALLEHAAARAARARAVGFNHFMVVKSARVAAIPASGKRLVPGPAGLAPEIGAALRSGRIGDLWDLALHSSAYSPGIQMEVYRVADYMESINHPTGGHILDYELWDTLSVTVDEPMDMGGETPGTLTVRVRQRHPLLISLAPLYAGALRSARAEDTMSIGGLFEIESHYPLYMEDLNW